MSLENLGFYSPTLEEICDRSPLQVTPDTPLEEVLDRMYQTIGTQCLVADGKAESKVLSSSYALVIEANKIVGIFTERDLVNIAASEKKLAQLTVSEVMTKHLFTLNKSEYRDVFGVLAILRQHRIRHLPAIDEQGNIFGVITQDRLRECMQPLSLLKLRTVAEVMHAQVICAPATTSVLDLARLMAMHQVSCVVIVENGETLQTNSPQNSPVTNSQSLIPSPQSPVTNSQSLKPIGMITERDIVQFKILGLDLARLPASVVMSAPLFCLNPTDSLAIAHQKMQRRRIRRLVVTGSGGELQGIVTQSSLLRPLDPVNLYDVVEVLQQKVCRLETENWQLLQQKNTDLEQQVQERAAALQQQARRDRLLADISLHIRQSIDINDILNITVTEIREFFAADRVIIYRFSEDWSGIVVSESVAEGAESLMGRVIYDPCFAPNWVEPYKKGRIHPVSDIYTAGMARCHLELLEQLQIRAKLLVPVLTGEELWGLMSVNQCWESRQWQPEEIELLEKVATQVAIAIQQATLFDRVQAELEERSLAETKLRLRAQQQEAIAQLGQIALAQTDLDALMDETAKIIAKTLQVSHCQVLELLPNRAALSLKAGIGWQQNWLGQAIVSVNQRTQAGYTLLQSQPIVVEDLRVENRFGGSPFLHNHGIISGITVVIPGKNNEAYGVLGVHTTTARNFTTDDVNFLQTAANILAIAIERRQAEEELNRFFNISLDMFCIAGIDGYFKRLNPCFESTLGYTETELLTKPFIDFVHPDDVNSTFTELEKLSAGIPSTYFENRYRTKEGNYRWFAWTSHPAVDGKLYSVAHDITQRKEAEAELKKLNEELETRVEQRTRELVKTVAELMQEISEHRRTEEKLRESEERFRNLVETSSDYIWEIDCNGNFTYLSPRVYDILGYHPQKLLGKNFFDLMLPQEAERVEEIFNLQVRARQSIHNLEHTLIHRQGYLIFVETSGTPIFNAQGQYKGYRGVERDITERKQGEAERQKLAALVENSSEFIVMTSVSGQLTYLNRGGRELVGLNEDIALDTKPITDFYSPADLSQIVTKILPKLRQGEADTGEIGLRHFQTGEIIPSLYNVFPIKERNTKQILAFAGIFHNLSERKKFELALQESKQQISDILESITEGYFALDKQWRFIAVNSYLEPILQRPATELIGKNIWSVFPEAIGTKFEAAYLQATEEQKTVAFEEYYPPLKIWFEVRVYPYKDGISVYFRDISDRKKAEEKIKASLREKELLLKEIHHRVKNNLLVVSSLLEWQADYFKNPKIIKMFENSQHRIQTMALIHEKLYRSDDLAQINFGDYLETLVNHIFMSCNPESQSVKIALDLQPINLNIETANPCGLIVNELVANIFKHAFPGDRKGKIWLKLEKNKAREITLIVKDNGVGFPETIDWQNTESLGLQLVCTLTEQIEGKLELERSHGTTFKLTFSELHYERRL
ncbi:PAS domain S-box protein [Oscillatoria salina]|uniref:PAS domain S-box protein n=1 Tax=Oscillatoria salina TaxID=331517 RepID=UPI001CCBFD44|nr:PAS domain S-box protein [Oscillatoria salina]MBZ8178727.1 PAS domain S-box protein [Oscillatoria salina IIICB1]